MRWHSPWEIYTILAKFAHHGYFWTEDNDRLLRFAGKTLQPPGPGVAGFEGPVREAIAGIVEPFVDEMRVVTLGNLIAVRRGTSGFKLMLDVHMDEIGFMVQHIDEQGFMSFTPIGG
jgi:hypothetical protein